MARVKQTRAPAGRPKVVIRKTNQCQDSNLVKKCKHSFDEVSGKCSICSHCKGKTGCVILVLCDKCNKYLCRICSDVRYCFRTRKVLCESCTKSE